MVPAEDDELQGPLNDGKVDGDAGHRKVAHAPHGFLQVGFIAAQLHVEAQVFDPARGAAFRCSKGGP